ncbi:FAD-dependent oxidoreductase [Buttiauxella warmboldiae]|uniref:FAD-dependent oxidoreductase n=1 Tax=Buttiauxella warmboldiae TaxID=82993 RepID=A0A3N5E1J9_9ENTR|nr:FAD-dependent oxidoreductase [Buttiauxella warmboldiae]RPH24136.1 FAD-dependent oxidoreductase [Buttiauxella warmboldiae]
MKYISEPARDIPVTKVCDVLVCGGGPAGFGAAIGAAKAGQKVIVIERNSIIGGMATAGLMSHWTGNTEGPVLDELLERARGSHTDYNYFGEKILRSKFIIDHEKLSLTMLKMLDEHNVEVMFYTQICDVIMDSNVLQGAIVENKSGRQAVLASKIIDATGDGDVACRAGAPYQLGRETDNAMQPVTLMMQVSGVDYSRAIFPGEFEDNVDVPRGKIQDLAHDYFENPMGHVLLYPSTVEGIVTVNMTNVTGIDGTNNTDISRSQVKLSLQVERVIDFLREYAPGYEQCRLYRTASMIGVRETRHFSCEYTITAEDIEQAKVFDDWIATRCYFNFDIHNIEGAGLDKTGRQNDFVQTERYTIPMRSLIPLKVENLLLAGRSIGGTHMAHSNFRAMAICLNIGQGAGVCAAIANKNKTRLRDNYYPDVRKELISQGVTV